MKRLALTLGILLSVSMANAASFSASITSTTFAANSPTVALRISGNETASYSVSGAFTGTLYMEKSRDNIRWERIAVSTANNVSGSYTGIVYGEAFPEWLRFRVSTITVGTITASIYDNDDFVSDIKNLKGDSVVSFYDETVRITGGVQATSTSNLNGYFSILQSTAPRSSTVGVTPPAAWTLIANTTDNELCVSTGATASTWVRVSTPTAACQH